jgi:DNA-binding FadR family transcriptional regulator
MVKAKSTQFKTFEQKRIYQKVAEHLSELITTNALLVGQRLPPERELAKKLKVSRNVVREAFLALEIIGFIQIRVGVGTFVVSKTPQPLNITGTKNFDIGVGPIDILAMDYGQWADHPSDH